MKNLNPQGQRGVVLLLMLLVVLISGSSLLLGAFNTRLESALEERAETLRQMQIAKQALLAYAGSIDVNFSAGPGHLPCPDLNKTDVPADCTAAIEYFGRLPQYVELAELDDEGNPRRFPLHDAYADIDQQFWYAVTPAFIYPNLNSVRLNSTTAGTLTVDGESGIAAVIIAPGDPLGQDRTVDPTDHTQYLEGGNGSDMTFVSSDPDDPDGFNDIVLTITRAEIMSMATAAVAKRIKPVMDAYFTECTFYPRADKNYEDCSDDIDGSGAKANFRALINGSDAPNWIKSINTATGRQNWMQGATISTYSYSNATQTATIKFANCTNVTYTFNPTNGLVRTGSSC